MKKAIIIITVLCMALPMMAQQKFFRNTLEKCLYEVEHPESLANPNMAHRFTNDFTARLDSVVGNNDFEWTQWKSEYTYTEQGLWNTEIYSVLENSQWQPSDKSEFVYDENGNCTQELHYKWNAGDWVPYYNQSTYFGATGLIDSIVTSSFDSVWINQTKRAYTYEDQMVSELMVYQFNGEHWDETNKYEYAYNNAGQMTSQIFSTIRNGQWRVNSKDSLCYENGLCTELLSYMRMMWGGEGWMLRSKTEFEYENGRISSQTSYSAGWFGGGNMSFDGKTDFHYDTYGQMVSKTTSIYNESEWIVRDEYSNRFDNEKKAAETMGCEAYWGLNSNYFKSDLGEALPIIYKWLDAKVVSSMADTQFALYYSDLQDIEEYESELKVYVINGNLVVKCPIPTDIIVFDLLGHNVARESQATKFSISLKPGLYLVKAGNTVVKVVLD